LKNILLALSLVASLTLSSNSFGERYTKSKTIAEVVDFIQQNFSYLCGVDRVSDKKTVLSCVTEKSISFVTIKKSPKGSDPNNAINEMKVRFINSKDGNFTIVNAIKNIQSKFSYVCGIEKIKRTIFGKYKISYNCNVQGLGNLIVDMKLDMSKDDDSRYEDLTVIFES